MRLTKFEHACVLLEDGGAKLLIDPGSFTNLPALSDVVGIVLTHQHPDHVDPENLRTLIAANPQVQVLGPAGVVAALESTEVQTAEAGTTAQLGPFELRFGGGVHAEIHRTIPRVDNLAVEVNGVFYHPGDSLDLPEGSVDVVAAPISGPWLKIGEVLDYINGARARRVLPIHEVLASDRGQALAHTLLGSAAEAAGSELVVLAAGESLDL